MMMQRVVPVLFHIPSLLEAMIVKKYVPGGTLVKEAQRLSAVAGVQLFLKFLRR